MIFLFFLMFGVPVGGRDRGTPGFGVHPCPGKPLDPGTLCYAIVLPGQILAGRALVLLFRILDYCVPEDSLDGFWGGRF